MRSIYIGVILICFEFRHSNLGFLVNSYLFGLRRSLASIFISKYPVDCKKMSLHHRSFCLGQLLPAVGADEPGVFHGFIASGAYGMQLCAAVGTEYEILSHWFLAARTRLSRFGLRDCL